MFLSAAAQSRSVVICCTSCFLVVLIDRRCGQDPPQGRLLALVRAPGSSIPIVNVVMILVFAFSDWPVDQELRRYRQGGYGRRDPAATGAGPGRLGGPGLRRRYPPPWPGQSPRRLRPVQIRRPPRRAGPPPPPGGYAAAATAVAGYPPPARRAAERGRSSTSW